MSQWKDVEQVVIKALEEGGKRVQEKLSVTPHEKLLRQRRHRQQGWIGHRNAYFVVNAALWLFFALIVHKLQPAMMTSIFWGIGFTLHYLGYRNWLTSHDAELKAAEAWARAAGKYHLYPSSETVGALIESGEPVVAPDPERHPLLIKAEGAAEQTRKSLEGLGTAEVEALAVVNEGLDRVRSLLNQLSAVEKALQEADAKTIPVDIARANRGILESQDEDTRSLYRSQLEMLNARADKVKTLEGLKERIVVFAESYLTALTNLRMDAAQLRASDVPGAVDVRRQLTSAKALEKQMDAMRKAASDVARFVSN